MLKLCFWSCTDVQEVFSIRLWKSEAGGQCDIQAAFVVITRGEKRTDAAYETQAGSNFKSTYQVWKLAIYLNTSRAVVAIRPLEGCLPKSKACYW